MKKISLCLLIIVFGVFIITGCNATSTKAIKKDKTSINQKAKDNKLTVKQEDKKTTKKATKNKKTVVKKESKKKNDKPTPKTNKKKATSKKEAIKKTKANVNIKQKKKKDTIVGNYEIIELKDKEVIYDKKTIESLEIEYSFEVKKDKTAIIKIDGEERNLTYDDNYFKNGKEKISYTYKDGKLVLFDEITSLTFKKK